MRTFVWMWVGLPLLFSCSQVVITQDPSAQDGSTQIDAPKITSTGSANALTDSSILNVSGTGIADSTVTVTVEGQAATCSAAVDSDGSWNCDLSSSLPNGTFTLSATQSDGNSTSSAATLAATVEGLSWQQEAYIKPPVADVFVFGSWVNPSNWDQFGYGLDLDGDTALVTAWGEASPITTVINSSGLLSTGGLSSGVGAAYVFQRSGEEWELQSYLKPPNHSIVTQFGISAAIDGDTALIHSRDNSDFTGIIHGNDLSTLTATGGGGAGSQGGVYVYKREGVEWSMEAYLKPPNPDTTDYFGFGMDFEGDIALISSYNEDSNTNTIINGSDLSATNNSGDNNGAVYVFERTDGVWAQTAYLKSSRSNDDQVFGIRVRLDGQTAAIAANRDTSTTTSILYGNDLSAETNLSGSNNGAVYIFERDQEGLWTQSAYIKAPNNSDDDYFGTGLGLDGDTLLVSSSREDSSTTTVINGSDLSATDDLGTDTGAAYVFRQTGEEWALEAFLKAPNASTDDGFGIVADLDGDIAVIGAYHEQSTSTSIINGSDLSTTNDDGSEVGAAYVYRRTNGTWSHEAYLKAGNASDGDEFGISVAVDGDTILVGAPDEASSAVGVQNGSTITGDDEDEERSGAMHVYRFKQ